MPTRHYSNAAIPTTLAATITASQTVIPVTSLSGYPAQFPYIITIDRKEAGKGEACLVTAVSGFDLTVERGYDNTAAIGHDIGAEVSHDHTAIDYREPQTRLDTLEGRFTGARAKDAVLLGGYGVNDFRKTWDNEPVHHEYNISLGRHTDGLMDWRRVLTVDFGSEGLDNTVANYTGTTIEVEITDHRTSWGQMPPFKPVRQVIRMTNSNTFTTGNAVTAAVEGEWDGYDYVRVHRVDNARKFELHIRPRADYQIVNFRIKVGAQSAGVLTWEKTGSPPKMPLADVNFPGGIYYFQTSAYITSDSRGYLVPTLVSPFSDYGGVHAARFMKRNGIVFIKGLVNCATAGHSGTVFEIPAGFRPHPDHGHLFIGQSSGGAKRFDVRSDGGVPPRLVYSDSAGGWNSIECSYPAWA